MGRDMICNHINNFYIINQFINKVFLMQADIIEPLNSIHSLSRQNNIKYRQLGASLLLTSSFVRHKAQLTQKRREKLENLNYNHTVYHNQVLKATKVGTQQFFMRTAQANSSSLSNIDTLKTHAKKLLNQETIKLGKENCIDQIETISQKLLFTQSDFFQTVQNIETDKKYCKRKIIRGRPEMYKHSKRRQFLKQLINCENPQKCSIKATLQKQPLNQLLKKNILMKFLTTNTRLCGGCQTNENLVRHKTIEQLGNNKKDRKFHNRRKSMTIFAPLHGNYQQSDQKNEAKAAGNLQGLKSHVLTLKKRRYDAIKTIQ